MPCLVHPPHPTHTTPPSPQPPEQLFAPPFPSACNTVPLPACSKSHLLAEALAGRSGVQQPSRPRVHVTPPTLPRALPSVLTAKSVLFICWLVCFVPLLEYKPHLDRNHVVPAASPVPATQQMLNKYLWMGGRKGGGPSPEMLVAQVPV